MHGFEIAADRGRFIDDRSVVEDQRWHCASRIDRQIGWRELFVRAQVDRHRFDRHPLFREKNPYPARAWCPACVKELHPDHPFFFALQKAAARARSIMIRPGRSRLARRNGTHYRRWSRHGKLSSMCCTTGSAPTGLNGTTTASPGAGPPPPPPP